MQPVKLSKFDVHENTYKRGDNEYRVKDLIALAAKETPFDLPLNGIDIGVEPWGELHIRGFCYHVKRMEQASPDYPVILDNTGYICDGWHRVAKAIIAGKTTIRAVRLNVMPEPVGNE